MDISNAFHFARNDSIKDFVPLTQIKTKSDMEYYNKKDYLIGYTLDGFTNKYPSIDTTKIFFCNGLNKTYYFDRSNYVLFGIHLFGTRFISAKEMDFEKQVNWMINDFTENIRNKNYLTPIIALNDRMRMEYFNMLMDDGIVDGLYGYFMEAYILSDYGCEGISYENMLKLFQSRTPEQERKTEKEVQSALKKYPKDIIVYRGEASKSTPYQKSWSWTVDINVANFFATRFGDDNSKIIVGKVNKSKIKEYIETEQECLINPSDVELVEIIDLHGHSWLESKMSPYILRLYHQYRDLIIDEYKMVSTGALHSPTHSARVLCLSLILGYIYKLNHEEMVTLANAVVYHDIGRVDDSIDNYHGKRSAEIFRSKRKKHFVDKKIATFLIEYHCLDDSVGIKYIEETFENSDRVILLYNIIKDADALDRVRFGKDGLNINYLRLDESKKMTSIAMRFIEEIKIN